MRAQGGSSILLSSSCNSSSSSKAADVGSAAASVRSASSVLMGPGGHDRQHKTYGSSSGSAWSNSSFDIAPAAANSKHSSSSAGPPSASRGGQKSCVGKPSSAAGAAAQPNRSSNNKSGSTISGKPEAKTLSLVGGASARRCSGTSSSSSKAGESPTAAATAVVKRRPPPLRRPDGKFASRADLAAEAAAAAVAVALAAAERSTSGSGPMREHQEEIQRAAAAFLRAYHQQLGGNSSSSSSASSAAARSSSSSSSHAAAASLHKELERLCSSSRVRAGLNKDQQEELAQQQKRFLTLLTADEEISLSTAADAMDSQPLLHLPCDALSATKPYDQTTAAVLPSHGDKKRDREEQQDHLPLLLRSTAAVKGEREAVDLSARAPAADHGAASRAASTAAEAAARRRFAARKAAEKIFPYCHPGRHESVNLNLLCLHTSCDDEEFLLRVALEKVSSQPASVQELERCFTTHGERFDLPWLDRRLANVQTLQQVRPRMQQLLAASRLRQQERLLLKHRLQRQALLRGRSRQDVLLHEASRTSGACSSATEKENNRWQLLPLVVSQEHQQHVLRVLAEQLRRFAPCSGQAKALQQRAVQDEGSRFRSDSSKSRSRSSSMSAKKRDNASSRLSSVSRSGVSAAAPEEQQPDVLSSQQKQQHWRRSKEEKEETSEQQPLLQTRDLNATESRRGQALPAWSPQLPEIVYPCEETGKTSDSLSSEQQEQQSRGHLAFNWQLEQLQQWERRDGLGKTLPPEFEELFDALKAIAAAQYTYFVGCSSSSSSSSHAATAGDKQRPQMPVALQPETRCGETALSAEEQQQPHSGRQQQQQQQHSGQQHRQHCGQWQQQQHDEESVHQQPATKQQPQTHQTETHPSFETRERLKDSSEQSQREPAEGKTRRRQGVFPQSPQRHSESPPQPVVVTPKQQQQQRGTRGVFAGTGDTVNKASVSLLKGVDSADSKGTTTNSCRGSRSAADASRAINSSLFLVAPDAWAGEKAQQQQGLPETRQRQPKGTDGGASLSRQTKCSIRSEEEHLIRQPQGQQQLCMEIGEQQQQQDSQWDVEDEVPHSQEELFQQGMQSTPMPRGRVENKLCVDDQQEQLLLLREHQEQLQQQAQKWFRDEEAELSQWRDLLLQLVQMEQGTPRSPHVQRVEEFQTKKTDAATAASGTSVLSASAEKR